jgi:hypothetical protein
MFRSSASLMAEDVTVRCRVRKLSSNNVNGDGSIQISNAPQHLNKDVDNATSIIEMTCTMRNWDTDFYGKSSSNRSGTSHHQQSSSRNMLLRNAFSLSNPDLRMDTNATNESSKMFRSDSAIDTRDTTKSNQTGPELFFTPTFDVSPSKSTRIHVSRRISPVSLQPYSVPINEILLVTYDIANNSDHELGRTKLHITTLSLGHYDMDCITSNGHDIVLAFLQASLPQERIVRDENKCNSTSKSSQSPQKSNRSTHKSKRKSGGMTNGTTDEIPSVNSTNSSIASSCFDIDALQAKHLAGRAEAETWYEKIQRRYGHVVSNILEQFDTCCNNTTSQQRYPSAKASETTIIKQSAERLEESKPHTASGRNTKPKSSVPSPTPCMSNGITGCFYGELEMDDNATDCSILNNSPPGLSHRHQNAALPTNSSPRPPKHNNHKNTNTGSSPQRYNNHHPSQSQQHQQIRISHMPSGLSVEPEPFDTESVR